MKAHPELGIDPARPHLGGYNRTHDGQGTWCPELWQKLIDDLGIKSMVEIGSGLGDTVRWFRDQGIYSLGIEGEPTAARESGAIIHDYTKGPRRVAECDLVWSAEVVEHIEEEFIDNFMQTFKAGRYVGLSAAQPGDFGYHHVNCRSPDYWIEVFKRYGFTYDREYTRALKRVVPFGVPRCRCIRNNFLFFRRVESFGESLARNSIVRWDKAKPL